MKSKRKIRTSYEYIWKRGRRLRDLNRDSRNLWPRFLASRVSSCLVQVGLPLPLRIVILESEPARDIVDVREGEPRDGEEYGKDELAPQFGNGRKCKEVGDNDDSYEAMS